MSPFSITTSPHLPGGSLTLISRLGVTLLGVFLLGAVGAAQAYNYPGAQQWQGQRMYPGQPYGYSPQPQANPWQRQPAAAPPAATPAPVSQSSQPQIEVSVNQTSGYLLQPMVYSIRILSDVNLASIDVTMPRIDGAAVEQLDGPRAFNSKDKDAERGIVTEVRYAVTPFKTGAVHIPPARIKLKTRSGRHAKTELKLESGALEMDVLPADRSVNPWLPLADLRISGRHDASQQTKVGDPFTLTFTMSAKGMSGDQLPSIASMLKSDDFKFYPEQPRTSQQLSTDGQTLSGKRVESFTVIPLRAGALNLPLIDIAYWDTEHHRRARAVWSGMHMNASGGDALGADGQPLHSTFFTDDYRQGYDLKFFWLPMLLVVLLTGGLSWWMSRGRPNYGQSREIISEHAHWQRITWRRRLVEFASSFKAKARQTLNKPYQLANRSPTVRRVTEQADATYRIWQCLHCVDRADDARGLCRILRRFACEYLRIPPNSSLSAIADALHKIRPRLDRDNMHQLFKQLDAAAYGSGKLDIPDWKRRFRALLRRVVFSHRQRRKERLARRKLPDLNPLL